MKLRIFRIKLYIGIFYIRQILNNDEGVISSGWGADDSKSVNKYSEEHFYLISLPTLQQHIRRIYIGLMKCKY